MGLTVNYETNHKLDPISLQYCYTFWFSVHLKVFRKWGGRKVIISSEDAIIFPNGGKSYFCFDIYELKKYKIHVNKIWIAIFKNAEQLFRIFGAIIHRLTREQAK